MSNIQICKGLSERRIKELRRKEQRLAEEVAPLKLKYKNGEDMTIDEMSILSTKEAERIKIGSRLLLNEVQTSK